MDNVSKTANKELMAQARASLSGAWWLAVGVMLVVFVILGAIASIPKAGVIGSLLVAGPFSLGLAIFSLALARKQNPQFGQVFAGFKKFGVALGAYLLFMIFVILWSLLLIIPGIIAAISYAMTFYIIADDDKIGPLEAIRKSKELMRGNKWKLFCLGARFIGWFLLCLLTFGIGVLWLSPYMKVSFANFYDDLIKKETV